jgi:hypothetical protein
MNRMSLAIRAETHEMFVRTGHELRNNIMMSMRNTTKRTTKPVKRGKGRYHFPSLPGFPPAVDKGRLVNDIKMSSEILGDRMKVEVGDVSVPYGKILEETENPKLRRPWLKPAYDNLNIEERIARVLERNINRP